jgi:flagellar assembly protein FliH
LNARRRALQESALGASDRILSRKIPKEKVGAASTWELRSLGETAQVSRNPTGLWSERERRAFERGREQGVLETTRAAQLVRAGHLERIGQVVANLQAGLDELASRGADALLDLSLEIARQVVRGELSVRRDAALPAVREAIALIVDHAAHPHVHLSPQDYELVRAELEADASHRGCRFVSDPSVPPGGCRIETPQGEIDATLDTRWRRVVATLGADHPGLSNADLAGPGHGGASRSE